ncbi:MAG: hypothetical protein IIC60_08220 [Proteobacteria bacterium]|nr:hypothetical protein [Pseudomonadota bacterium]
MTRRNLLPICVVISCIAGFNHPAYAYLDPNIGSMLVQGLIAGIAVISIAIKTYWYRLVAFCKGEKYESEEDLLADLDFDSEEDAD